MLFRNNLIRSGKQLISLKDMGSLNQNIMFSEGKKRVRPWSKHKNAMVKVQNDICTCTHNIIIKFWPFIKTRSTLSHLKESGKKQGNNVKKSKNFFTFFRCFFPYTYNICKQTNIRQFSIVLPLRVSRSLHLYLLFVYSLLLSIATQLHSNPKIVLKSTYFLISCKKFITSKKLTFMKDLTHNIHSMCHSRIDLPSGHWIHSTFSL